MASTTTGTGPGPHTDQRTDSRTDEERSADLAGRMLSSLTAGAELLSVELGRRLGLYETLAATGPSRPPDLALRAGIAERYAREWLEQQAAAGFLAAREGADGTADRTFELPAAHVPVLVDPDSPFNVMGAASLVLGLALPLVHVERAYRTGEGVGFARYGAPLREGLAMLNRPGFTHDLRDWVAQVPGVTEALRDHPAVLDLGCGEGWSTVSLARALPEARVLGIDLDEASIHVARRRAADLGLAGRVEFRLGDATGGDGTTGLEPPGGFGLVTIFEALHDMGDPPGALRQVRRVLAPGASLLVADERVSEEFTAPAEETERLQYAFSALHCVPATMAESPRVVNGTVLRAPTLRAWAREAGFERVDVLPVEHEFWRFYALG